MTRRATWAWFLFVLLALVSIPVVMVHWFIGSGCVLIVSNVGSTPIEGASVVILTEGGIDDVREAWPLPTITPGSSVKVDVGGPDSNAGLRLRQREGGTRTQRIAVYLGPYYREIRANVAEGRIVNALSKSLRGSECDEARVLDVPVEIPIPSR